MKPIYLFIILGILFMGIIFLLDFLFPLNPTEYSKVIPPEEQSCKIINGSCILDAGEIYIGEDGSIQDRTTILNKKYSAGYDGENLTLKEIK